jgi:hypothetical protein
MDDFRAGVGNVQDKSDTAHHIRKKAIKVLRIVSK